MDNLLRTSSLILVTIAIVAALLVATEIGRRFARRHPGRREDKDASTLATGMLGIFALLIAFTYSLSLARYDTRRAVLLEEANAIGTTANYALMLPVADRAAVMRLLRTYTKQRIDLGSPYDHEQFARQAAAGNAVLTQLWQQATATTAAGPQSLPAYRFVAALNEQTNVAEARLTALRNHVPPIVLFMLVLVATVSMGLAGFSAGVSGYDRYVGLTIMAVTIALLIALVLDLDRPNRGSIEVSKQPLIDALSAIPAR